jgi:6,7-dimethyl-8-ribityllumazine synthase
VEHPAEPEFSTLEGKLNARGKRFAIVVARFNSFITERLLQSACDGLLRSGAARKDIAIVRVPGAFEIPSAARTLALTRRYDSIICLGCLLRGDTAHYDVIVNEVTRGIGQSAQETGVPHAFGVLTCETLVQAIDRAGLKMGNKGFEAALAAVEMASLTSAIRPPASGFRKGGIRPGTSDNGEKQIPRFARNDKTENRNDKIKSRDDKSKKARKTKRRK